MNARLLAASLLLLSAVPGFAADKTYSLSVDGRLRTWTLHVPPSYRPGRPTPLVVLYHGGGGSGRQAQASYRMDPVADREGFLVAYPDGTGMFRRGLFTWNAGNCCEYALEHDVDDVAFTRAMMDRIRRDFTIDERRIYATGISNGGMMSYRVACEMAGVFAAIAPVAGALNIPCHPSDEVSVVIFHGTDDQHVPYEGGIGPKARNDRVDAPVSHAVDFWVKANRCSPVPSRTRKGSIATDLYTGCAEGTAVSLHTIIGGSHSWPGGLKPRSRSLDQPTQEISASEVMWEFFEAHPKR
jgi:polyhydroxybutyrate depolymerase